MSLPTHIRDNLEAVLRDWQAYAVSLAPHSTQLPSLAPRDHAAQILCAIADDVETLQSTEDAVEKSSGHRLFVSRATETAAQIHGAMRQQAGFNISQLAAEYRALRSSVLRSWREVRIPLPTDDDGGSLSRGHRWMPTERLAHRGKLGTDNSTSVVEQDFRAICSGGYRKRDWLYYWRAFRRVPL